MGGENTQDPEWVYESVKEIPGIVGGVSLGSEPLGTGGDWAGPFRGKGPLLQ